MSETQLSCPHCSYLYTFAVADIPEGGYEAQCVQCQGLFFVERPQQGSEAPEPSAGNESPLIATPEDTEVSSYEAEEETRTHTMVDTSMDAAPDAEPEPPPEETQEESAFDPTGGTQNTQDITTGELDIITGQFTGPIDVEGGEIEVKPPDTPVVHEDPAEAGRPSGGPPTPPAPPPPPSMNVDEDSDWDQAKDRKQRRKKVVGIAAAALVATCVVGAIGSYFAAPRVFDSSVGSVIGIKAPVPPEAEAKVAEALEAMLADTQEGFAKAASALEEARRLDPYYVDAVAYTGLLHAMQGALDVLWQGQHIVEAKNFSDKIKELKAMKRPPKGHAEMGMAFTALAEDHNTKAYKRFEVAQTHFEAGKAEVDRAYELDRNAASTVLVTGLYGILSNRKSGGGPAKAALERYCQIEGLETCETADFASPYGAYLSALVRESFSRKSYDAIVEWEAILDKHPTMLRAKLEMTRLLDENNRLEGYQDRLRTMVAELQSAAPENGAVGLLAARWTPKEEVKEEPAEDPTPKRRKRRRRRRPQ